MRPYIRNSQLDSLQRLENWVKDRLVYLDKKYDFQDIPNTIKPTEYTLMDGTEQVCYYSLSGIPTKNPTQSGLYIKTVRYGNGQIKRSKVFLKAGSKN